jgi:hypothetical protein
MSDTKGVRQVLEEALLVWKQDYPKKDGEGGLDMDGYFKRLEEAKETALATLQEIMLGMLPEKKPSKFIPVKNMDGVLIDKLEMLSPEHRGYNAALKLIKQNIRGGFRSE